MQYLNNKEFLSRSANIRDRGKQVLF